MFTYSDDEDTVELDDNLTVAQRAQMPTRAELLRAIELIPVRQAGDLVRLYYAAQEQRIRLANQIRAAAEAGEPVAVSEAVQLSLVAAERRAAWALDKWTELDPLASWARQIMGIGPVIAAGLRSEIDVARSPHASSLWRYAGQDPTADKRIKGQKLVFNSFLKTLCWKIGDSFVKVSGKEASLYGRLYREAKELYTSRNEQGAYAEQAAAVLARTDRRPPAKGTDARAALEAGRLPKAQIDARARRKTVKIFLAHYWTAGRILAGLPHDDPWVIEKAAHQHLIGPEVPYPEM